LMRLVPSMRDSYYYVLESYTTLGEGAVSLPNGWRLIGPIIAMSGLFTFGWTGSVLVNIMTEFGKVDRIRAKRRGIG
jgi:ion channel